MMRYSRQRAIAVESVTPDTQSGRIERVPRQQVRTGQDPRRLQQLKQEVLPECRRRASFLARFRQLFPGHEHETLFLEELPELRALDHVQIVLPPCRAPVGMIEGRTPHLFVVVS